MQKDRKKNDNKLSEENLRTMKLETKLEDYKDKANKKLSDITQK